jgi:hypothetical protein
MGVINLMSNYRNKKLTQSAKHEACVSCGADDGTIVWAHSNSSRHGKGMGIKAHDLFGAYLCHKCHSVFDNGSGEPLLLLLINCRFPHPNKERWFFDMWERSMITACEKGYI